MFHSIDHLNMTVADLEESADWYGKIFGFKEVERGVYLNVTPWRILRSRDAMLCLYEHNYDENERTREAHRVNHYGFRITNQEEWERTIASHKLKISYGGSVRRPHSRSWYVNDPTGHEIEVTLWDNDCITFDS